MSHTTTIKSVPVRDIRALHSAVNELKAAGVDCDLVENAKPRMYYANQHGNCEWVVKLNKGNYDVGFAKQADGTYAPVFDAHAGYVRNNIGIPNNACPLPANDTERREFEQSANIGKLMQLYSKHAALNQAQAEGYQVESCEIDNEGNIHLMMAV